MYSRSRLAVWRQRGDGALSGCPIFGDSHSSTSTPSLRFQTSLTTPSEVHPPMMTAFGLLGRPVTQTLCPVRSDGPLSGFLICGNTRRQRSVSNRLGAALGAAAARQRGGVRRARNRNAAIARCSRAPDGGGGARHGARDAGELAPKTYVHGQPFEVADLDRHAGPAPPPKGGAGLSAARFRGSARSSLEPVPSAATARGCCRSIWI